MSFHARRRRDEELDQERALLAMRNAVVGATTAKVPWAGSSATLDAVDEALAQLVAAGAHLGDAHEVKARWIKYAHCRLIDEQRSAEAKHRHGVAIDDEAHAHTLSACGDLVELSEERQLSEARRDLWRVREILSVLRGEQRKWAEAWYREISGPRKPGVQPRGLPEVLGWTQSKTEKTAQRARAKMVSFVQQRQAGDVCVEQQALLDGFITASREDLGDHEPYEAVLIHVAGCEDCFAAWNARRRSLLGRCSAVIMVPYDSVLAAAHAFADKLASAAAGAQGAAATLLQRLGIGGGTAAAGGGIAAVSTKTAAVCATVICAASAGVGEVTGVLPPIIPSQKHSTTHDAARKTAPVARTAAKPVRLTPPPAITPPPPPPAAHKKQHATATSAASPRSVPTRTTSAAPPPAATSTRPFTPGDLPPAGSSAATAPSSSPTRTRTPSSATQPSCVPGDLNC